MTVVINIQLVMIVKNSGNVLEETLKSYKPYISSWCILDTGSTDNTKDIIISTLKNIPGKLYEEPFINFSVSRNRAIELGEELTNIINTPTPNFQIMPDDSYILFGGNNLKAILKKAQNYEYNTISIKIIQTETNNTYKSVRIWKYKKNCRYVYSIHEVIKTPTDEMPMSIDDNNIYMLDKVVDDHTQRSFDRYNRDIKLLLEEYELNDQDPRIWFYIARTYNSLENDEKTIEWYKKRANYIKSDKSSNKESNSNSFTHIPDEEAFESCIELAKVYCKNNDYNNAMIWAMEAYNKCIYRGAESLYTCYKILLQRSTNEPHNYKTLHSLAFSFIQRAYQLPFPTESALNISIELYEKDIPFNYAGECLQHNKYKEAESVLLELDKKVKNRNFLSYGSALESDEKIVKSRMPIILGIESMLNTIKEQKNILRESIQNKLSNQINNQINTSTQLQQAESSKQSILVFVTDSGFSNWNANSKNIRGSEISLINFAETFSKKGYKVYAFVPCKDNQEGIIRNVEYISCKKFKSFTNTCANSNISIDHVIVSRTPIYLKDTMKANIKNVYLWLHDINPYGDSLIAGANFRGVWCLSSWHHTYVKELYGIPTGMIKTVSNAIIPSDYLPKLTAEQIHRNKIKRSFIYCSGKERNLNSLLKIFKVVRKNYNDATLCVICNNIDSEDIKTIKSINKLYQGSITISNQLIHEEFIKILLKTEYWVYPTDFSETFCIVALEAQASGCLCLCSDLAGLKDTVGNRGILLKQPILNINFVNEYFNCIQELENSIEKKLEIIEKSREWSLQQTYENVSNTWFK